MVTKYFGTILELLELSKKCLYIKEYLNKYIQTN